MKCTTIFQRPGHRWLAFGQDPAKPSNVIDTNQLVVEAGGAVMLMDPGGTEVFPSMIAALTREVAIEDVRHLLLSHQDPDVSSSLPLWRRICRPDLKVYAPWMWTGFVSHFDSEAPLTAIPDEGVEIRLSPDVPLQILPAHYMHSPGNYHVYDPVARVYFSGDVGAALVPEAARKELFVQDFAGHVQYMEGFHRRWMSSPAARDAWVEMVSRLDVNVLAPQHGLMFRGDNVKRFLDWLARLQLASGIGAIRADALKKL